MEMLKLISKLENEAKKLQKKIKKLSNFLVSPQYEGINKTHQNLLYSQYRAMRDYHYILEDRIELLKKGVR